MKEIDALGKRCPQPIIDLARAMRNYRDEGSFTLRSDDPATWSDLSAWSRMTGNNVERIDDRTFRILRSAKNSSHR